MLPAEIDPNNALPVKCRYLKSITVILTVIILSLALFLCNADFAAVDAQKSASFDEQSMTVQDGYVYYVNSENRWGIYRMAVDGSKKNRITDRFCFQLLSVTDGWVYFLTLENKENKLYGDNRYFSIYKARGDGKKEQRVTKDECRLGFVVSGGWIYYLNSSDKNRFYKMRTDGSNRRKLSDDSSGAFFLDNGWIHYSFYKEDLSRVVYKICIDGSGKQESDRDPHDFFPFFLKEDGVYRISDGNNEVKLSSDVCSHLIAEKDWLYFVTKADELYKMRMDGKERQKLGNIICSDLCVDGEQIYYINKGKMGKINTDGSGHKLLG